MEPIYKKGNKFFGETSGLQFDRSSVYEKHPGCWWTYDTEYPMYPSQKDGASSTTVKKPKGGLKGKGGV